MLAAVLLVAALTKLRAPEVTRRQTVALTGSRPGPVIAATLPWVELVLAAALVLWWSPVPGILAVLLLLAFTAIVVRALTRRLPCPCFAGTTSRAAATPAALVRNGVLLAYAVLATGSPRGAAAGAALLAVVALGLIAAAAVVGAR